MKGGVVVVGDMHLSNYTKFSKVAPNGGSDRLNEMQEYIDRIRKYARKQCAAAIWLGDLFHTAKSGYISTHVMKSAIHTFYPQGIDEVFIPGNHDIFAKGSDLYYSLPCVGWDDEGRTHVAKYRTTIDGGRDGMVKVSVFEGLGLKKNICVMCWPYSEGLELGERIHLAHQVAEDHDTWGEDNVFSIFAAHQGLREDAERYGGLDTPGLMGVDDIPDYYDLAVFGHFHSPRRLPDDVFIVGSMGMLSFGDDPSQEYGPMHFWKEGGEVKFSRLDLGMRLPRFITVTAVEHMRRKVVEGNFVRLIPPNERKAKKWKNKILGLGARGVEVKPVVGAAKRKKGARPLRSRPRDVLLDYMDDVPPQPPKKEVLSRHDDLAKEVGEGL